MTTTITAHDLADEMADRYDITTDAARQGVDAYVDQLVGIDGDEATIAATEDRHNGSGRLIGQEVTLTAAAADAVRESFAAEYAN